MVAATAIKTYNPKRSWIEQVDKVSESGFGGRFLHKYESLTTPLGVLTLYVDVQHYLYSERYFGPGEGSSEGQSKVVCQKLFYLRRNVEELSLGEEGELFAKYMDITQIDLVVRKLLSKS